jgi:Tfp pilus assembly protein PilF
MAEFLIDQAMKEAIDLQNRNQLDDAKSIYNKILAHDKNNSDAYHLLSLIYLVGGKT